jgi:hypothetical protein
VALFGKGIRAMKKPSLTDAPAPTQRATPPSTDAEIAASGKPRDSRTTTTLRIEPAQLEALKIIAAKKRMKVNDLLLEGAAHVLALYGEKWQ